ncbi:MAG: hypothetical protein OdinLCB4_003690 [Candidatus Odinarchaeum yellowstonii]|uniref:Topoisomerase 6 subunit A/Spo11 TOPRIM domain-containing protein n=1 Tax=Odinarchaeota yellowstonii (strain LCB_4) TaxID=1841599 RepID=A0AAF0D3J7_ODILC|nr:MAG: hypothetical protein OdinLCB4_003690 [Candidatus Odinarchaeum yellowstonii]
MQFFPGTKEAWLTVVKEKVTELIDRIIRGDYYLPDSLKNIDKRKIIYVLEFILEIIRVNRNAVLEDIIYSPKARGVYKISDREELENILIYLEGVFQAPREDFMLFEDIPTPVYGPLKIEYFSPSTSSERVVKLNDRKRIRFLDPLSYKLNFLECKADKVLVTGFNFENLIEREVSERLNCILIGLGTHIPRSTRYLLRRLNLELNLPVYILTDATPLGLLQCIDLIKGSSERVPSFLQKFIVSHAMWVGVSIGDILEEYQLSPLNENDFKILEKIKENNLALLQPYKQELQIYYERKVKSEYELLKDLDIVKYISAKIP